jgi:hypothetical protein
MSQSTVRAALTANRPTRPVVENDQYTVFARRILAAHGRRIAAGDIEGLPGLLALACELDTHIQLAVEGLHAFGYSWADIAARAGISRQTAHERWGHTRP